jgi:hypothetical protein
MSNEAADTASANYGAGALQSPGRIGFYQVMSGTLLLILLAGFAPTLYLRAAFEAPDMPVYLHVHGVTLTCWFLFLVLQTSLVAGRRTDIHRRTGIAGALLAVAVVFAGPMATMGFMSRLQGIGVDTDALIYHLSWVVWANFLSILAFAIFVGAGIVFRRRSDIHKRLIMLATISIIGPPLARISRWFYADMSGEIPFVVAGSLILLAVLVIYDLVATGRLHKATIAGGLYCALTILAPLVIAGTEFAQAFVRGMG